jgi:hypothetical protein
VRAAGDGDPQQSPRYKALVRRLNAVRSLLWLLVIATVAIMAIKP